MFTDKRGFNIEPGDIVALVGTDGSILIFEVLYVSADDYVRPVIGSMYIQRHENPRDNDGNIYLVPTTRDDTYLLELTGIKTENVYILRQGTKNFCAESEKELLAAYDKMAVV